MELEQIAWNSIVILAMDFQHIGCSRFVRNMQSIGFYEENDN